MQRMNPIAMATAMALACAAPAQEPWAFHARAGGEDPRGAFPVGNGLVGGVLGTGGPAHEVAGLRPAHDHGGEGLHASDGVRLVLRTGGSSIAWSAHVIERVAGTAIYATADEEQGGLVLRTETFSPPGAHHLVQLVEVHNTARRVREDAAVRVETTGGPRVVMPGSAGGVLPLGDLPPGGRRRFAVTLAPAGSPERPPALEPDLAESLAAATARWWKERLSGTLHVRSDPPRFAGLIDAAAVALLALRCGECGGVAADERSGALRPREATGPLLAFLRLGLWEEARDLLRLHFAAATRHGRLPEQLPGDPAPVPEPVPGTDWDLFEVPPGDLPSLVVLQHYWYWRATGDRDLVREHWPLLDACLKNAPRGPGGLAARSYADSALFVQAVAAMGALRRAFGAGSAAWARRSGELLHEMERRYWREGPGRFAPFVDRDRPVARINLLPVWSGQLAATGNRARDNVRNTLALLARNDARIGSSDPRGDAEGMVQGMLVTALTQFESRGRRAALDALVEMAEPAGSWGRQYGSDGRVTDARDGTPIRLSSMATGVNLDAALFAVTGLRYATAPGLDRDWLRLRVHLPRDTRNVQLRGMAGDGRRLDLGLTEVPSEGDSRRRLRFDLTLRSSSPERSRLALVHCMGVLFQRHLEVDRTVTESADWVPERERLLPHGGR